MEQSKVEERVLALLAGASGKKDCRADMDIMDEIGLSSVEVLNLITGLEQEYGVKIPSRELRFVATAEDLAALICKKKGW